MIRKLSVGAILMILSYSTVSATDTTGGFLYDGINRTYLLHIPPSYNGKDSVPLVLNLHWGGGTPAGQAAFCEMNPKADSEGFIVVYPCGTLIPYGWLGWNSSECLESDVDDVGFISNLIDTLEASYRIDTLRIYATGFCNGAMMVHKLACELSSKIAAFAPVAAGLTEDNWNACQPQRPVSIMHLHARNDPSVPYYGGWYYNCYWPTVDSFMNYWVEKLGCEEGPDSFYNEKGALRQRWTRSDDSCELILWTTEDGSHYWPGSLRGSKAVSANDEMWEFFKAHPMPVKEEEPAVQEFSADYVIDPGSPGIFTRSATIRFTLNHPEHVQLKLYDKLGREIVTLLDGLLAAGPHEVVVDASGLSGGVYFYRLITETFNKTQPIVIRR